MLPLLLLLLQPIGIAQAGSVSPICNGFEKKIQTDEKNSKKYFPEREALEKNKDAAPILPLLKEQTARYFAKTIEDFTQACGVLTALEAEQSADLAKITAEGAVRGGELCWPYESAYRTYAIHQNTADQISKNLTRAANEIKFALETKGKTSLKEILAYKNERSANNSRQRQAIAKKLEPEVATFFRKDQEYHARYLSEIEVERAGHESKKQEGKTAASTAKAAWERCNLKK